MPVAEVGESSQSHSLNFLRVHFTVFKSNVFQIEMLRRKTRKTPNKLKSPTKKGTIKVVLKYFGNGGRMNKCVRKRIHESSAALSKILSI